MTRSWKCPWSSRSTSWRLEQTSERHRDRINNSVTWLLNQVHLGQLTVGEGLFKLEGRAERLGHVLVEDAELLLDLDEGALRVPIESLLIPLLNILETQ